MQLIAYAPTQLHVDQTFQTQIIKIFIHHGYLFIGETNDRLLPVSEC
jgi:hypothetical protein